MLFWDIFGKTEVFKMEYWNRVTFTYITIIITLCYIDILIYWYYWDFVSVYRRCFLINKTINRYKSWKWIVRDHNNMAPLRLHTQISTLQCVLLCERHKNSASHKTYKQHITVSSSHFYTTLLSFLFQFLAKNLIRLCFHTAVKPSTTKHKKSNC